MTAVPPFKPSNISGCQLWLDGTDPAGTGVAAANGATLTSWTDKSGSGNSVTLPSLTYSLNTYTGYSGVVFTSGTASSQLTLTPFECFFASSYSTGPYFPTSYPGLLGQTSVIMYGNYYTVISANVMGPGGGFNNFSSAIFGDYKTDSRNMTVSGAYSSPSSSFTLRVGSGDGYPNNSWLGHIYEVIVFNVALSTAQRKQVEGYLAQKWGLRQQLPQEHPGQKGIIYPTIKTPLATPLVYPSSFVPTQIANCTLWLDGADPAGTGTSPSSGATVTSWIDKSTTGNNFSGSATYSLDSTYNKYGLLFTGSTYFSQVNGSKYSITNTTYTIFTVHRFTNDSVGVGEVYRSNNISGFWFRQQGTGVNWITDTDPAGYVNVSGGSSTVSGIGCMNTLTTSSATAYINGSSVGSSSRGTTTNVTFHIGAVNGGELLQGTIFEMLIYNITLSTPQQQQVEGYLAWKWGLQGSLPANHSYKNSAPDIPNALGISRPTYVAAVVPTPVTKVVPSSKTVIATGGNTVVTANGYKIHTFTTVGSAANFVLSANPGNNLFQVLVVGGGGCGGADTGGGGGGGGAAFVSSMSLISTSYNVVVGAGGTYINTDPYFGSNGGNSSFNSIIGIGGGTGGMYQGSFTYGAGSNGGCGGGACGPSSAVGLALQSGGYSGGTGAAGGPGGGGGGMGSVGSNATLPINASSWVGGNGGNGYTYTIGGTAYLVSGGGGGGSYNAGTGSAGGSGGTGGGGNGSLTSVGSDATYYGGGGGGSCGGVQLHGGSGYQGLVIIAYQYP